MTDIWEAIEARRRELDVLRHPFYLRWTAGELKRSDLARYAGQYRHVVEAVAEMSTRAAQDFPDDGDLARHAREECAHVIVWAAFNAAAGGQVDAPADPHTAAAVSRLQNSANEIENLAKLYALEHAQPEIAHVKHDGLIDLYGFSPDRGTEYFRVHATLDLDHAAQIRRLLAEESGPEDEPTLVGAAEQAYRANWELLDGLALEMAA